MKKILKLCGALMLSGVSLIGAQNISCADEGTYMFEVTYKEKKEPGIFSVISTYQSQVKPGYLITIPRIRSLITIPSADVNNPRKIKGVTIYTKDDKILDDVSYRPSESNEYEMPAADLKVSIILE